ncbi:Hpt domain-containing protein [Halobacteriovorax sp. GB3]|uniref:Hpt domain-containing protein n=1 Tax=Halobacteriovorax sp. GB3 TaxID=2719615 RepID=UPI00235F8724|nr:Hpt domain-containing protein [Halobacteriovorax sp. GB3]MDD0851874.1 Hpt domain-containing protein [Halobacteriovorax sp. GB3]
MDDQDILNEFKLDALEILDEIERVCLTISPESLIHSFQRELLNCLHSLKGSSAMFGFYKIESWMHKLESSLRDKEIDQSLSENEIQQFFYVIDLSRSILNGKESEKTPEVETSIDIIPMKKSEEQKEKIVILGSASWIGNYEDLFDPYEIVKCQNLASAFEHLKTENTKGLIANQDFCRGNNFLKIEEYFSTSHKVPTLLLDKNKEYFKLLKDSFYKNSSHLTEEELKENLIKFLETL